jgi:beta-galactosidase
LAAVWEAAGLNRAERTLLDIARDGPVVTVQSEVRVGTSLIAHRQVISPTLDGGLHVAEEAEVPAGLDDLPRLGTVLEIVPGFEDVEWFGRGPHESYPDRSDAGITGRWRSTVSELHVPYIRPQESGGRADVRWLELKDKDGRTLSISLGEPSQVSATHYRAADLAATTHHEELVAAPETIVHLDAAHRGLGTASCGPDTLPDYLVRPGTYRWEWSLRVEDDR